MKIFILLFIGWSLSLNAQSFTEKYNVRLQRIEYYDLSGNFTGYSKEDTKYNRIVYYDSSGIVLKTYPQTELLFNKTGLEDELKLPNIRRWSYVHHRYEVFDSLGQVTGYYKFDGLIRSWSYYSGNH
jgi:hypothetical protein